MPDDTDQNWREFALVHREQPVLLAGKPLKGRGYVVGVMLEEPY